MILPPPDATRTDTHFPYTTLFRSQLPTVTTETGAIDDLYLKIVFLEHLSRNYELRIKVLLLRTIIGDRDAAELTRRSLAPPFSLEHILDREEIGRAHV